MVGIHEWGHYRMALALKIKVEAFSIGMGPTVLSWKSKTSNILYTFKALPLGGFVAFQKSDLAKEGEDVSAAFDLQPIYKRALVVAAGPAMNLVLAVVLMFVVGLMGTNKMDAVITGVVEDSLVDNAGFEIGDKIVSINGVEVKSLNDFGPNLLASAGDYTSIYVENKDTDGSMERILDLTNFKLSRSGTGFPTFDMGFVFPTYVDFTVNSITEQSDLLKDGVQPGDRLLEVNNKKVHYLLQLEDEIEKNPLKEVELKFARGNNIFVTNTRPYFDNDSGSYVLGLLFEDNKIYDSYFKTERYGVIDAMNYGVEKTIFYSTITVQFIKRLFTGDISFNMISGPVGIAKASEKAASLGLIVFMSFGAMLSANIAVMNLIPLPGLDGGHLLLYAVEAIRRKRLSEVVEKYLMRITMILIIVLLVSSLYIDFKYSI